MSLLNCEHHFMMYVSQIFILYTLNLHNAENQLYLNKTKKKKTISHVIFRQRLIMVLSAYARAKTLYFFFKKGC